MFFFLRDNKSKRKAILIFFLQKLCRDVIVEKKKKKEIHKAGIFTRNLRGTPWRNIVIRNSMVYKVLR